MRFLKTIGPRSAAGCDRGGGRSVVGSCVRTLPRGCFTGFVAHDVCAKTFVSGFNPAEVFAEDVRHPGVKRLKWLMRYDIDRAAGRSTCAAGGFVASRAIFRKGSGCVVLAGDKPPVIVDPVALAPGRRRSGNAGLVRRRRACSSSAAERP